MNIGQRLKCSHGLLLVLTVVVASWSLVEFEGLYRRMTFIVDVSDAKVAKAQKMLDAINEAAIRVRTVTLLSATSLTNGEGVDAEVLRLDAAIKNYAASAQALSILGLDDANEKLLWQAVSDGEKKTLPLVRKAVDQARGGAMVAASTTLTLRVTPVEQAWRENVRKLIEQEVMRNGEAVQSGRMAKRRAVWVVSILVGMTLLAGMILARAIARSVKLPIDLAIDIAERIAAGDLSTEIEIGRSDEVGRLLQAIAMMQEKLRTLVAEIRHCSDSIMMASDEVASGNRDLSARTAHAATSLEKTSAQLHQLTEQMARGSEFAHSAGALASRASSNADEGAHLVRSVSSAMVNISESSSRIAEITTVINGIALQTRLLALNAAIEAAHAGEFGRGFAVVANEVGRLAIRSATAASEIDVLIKTSTDQVDGGSAVANAAGGAMEMVVSSARDVAHTVSEIQSTIARQCVELEQLSSAASLLDQMTQKNSALVEQTASAADLLRGQSAHLLALVGSFRFDRQQLA